MVAICNRCGKDFKKQFYLNRHMKRKFPCKCLIVQIKDETDAKSTVSIVSNYECKYCKKTFSCTSTLNRHIRISCKTKKDKYEILKRENLEKDELIKDLKKNIFEKEMQIENLCDENISFRNLEKISRENLEKDEIIEKLKKEIGDKSEVIVKQMQQIYKWKHRRLVYIPSGYNARIEGMSDDVHSTEIKGY